MKITLLPDLNEWKLKIRKIKEKKEKRKQAKQYRQRCRYLKRRSFLKIFVLTLAVVTLIVGGVSFGVLYYSVGRAVEKSKDEIDEWTDLLQSDIKDRHEYLNDQTLLSEEEIYESFKSNLYLHICTLYQYYSFLDASVLLYDGNGNKIIGSDDKIGLVHYRYKSNSNELLWSKSYKSGSSLPEEIVHKYYDYMNKRSQGLQYDVIFGEGYLDGDVFYYGGIEFYKPSKTGGLVLSDTYDFSPADTTGMQVIDIYAKDLGEDGYDYLIPIMSIPSNDECMADAKGLYEEYKDDKQLDGATSTGNKGFGKYSRQIFNRIQISDDEDYILVTSVDYDFMDKYGALFVNVVFGIICFILLLSLIIARSRYLRMKAHYDLEDYQRNLTNSMAHDLKSPLMVLSGMAENLVENVHIEKREYYAKEIMRLTSDMNRMVEQILGFSKLDDTYMIKHKETVDMCKLTEEVLKGYKDIYEDDGLFFDVEGELMVQGDSTMLKQMIDNLISNAILHGEKGVISIEMGDNKYEVTNAYKGKLKQEDVPRLITAYEKEDSRKRTGGHGLGLSIVNQITKLHSAKLEVSIKDEMFCVSIMF